MDPLEFPELPGQRSQPSRARPGQEDGFKFRLYAWMMIAASTAAGLLFSFGPGVVGLHVPLAGHGTDRSDGQEARQPSLTDGWKSYGAQGLEIRLPEPFMGGIPTSSDIEARLEALRKSGTTEAELQQMRDQWRSHLKLAMAVPGGSAAVNAALFEFRSDTPFEVSVDAEQQSAASQCGCPVSRADDKVDGFPATRLEYSAKDYPFEGWEFTNVQYFVKAGSHVWTITYSCFASCDAFVPVFRISGANIRIDR